MIAQEHIQKIRVKDAAITIVISLVTALMIFLLSKTLSLPTLFLVSLIVHVVGMNVAVYMTKKFSIAVFSVVGSSSSALSLS